MVSGATTAQITADLAAIAAQLRQSTVKISGSYGAVGSGVIWRDGLVVTNAHVVREGQTLIELASGQMLKAQLTARDSTRDLAVLRAAVRSAVTVGNSRALRPGELVLVIGNTFGSTGALTTGIVYALSQRRQVEAPHRRKHLYTRQMQRLAQDWLQASIRLAPGNSGGPLATAQGHVVGINTMVAGGLALAVPSHEVERFLQEP